MYMYTYCWDKLPLHVPLWFFVFGDKWICRDSLIFIHFPASIWKWHALVMYYIYGIEEIEVSGENLCSIICYICKEKQIHCENIFIVCLLLHRGISTSWRPLIALCYIPLLRKLIYLEIFESFPIFNGFIPLVSVNAILCVY